ncbi:MAG: DUF2867 domain-containing protein [Bacteroidetes bacterium]|nr:DUF2867 domain-containing protein [Bacteroidota bacterium]
MFELFFDWNLIKTNEKNTLTKTATFRPLGLPGKLYWYVALPLNGFIFCGLLKKNADG